MACAVGSSPVNNRSKHGTAAVRHNSSSRGLVANYASQTTQPVVPAQGATASSAGVLCSSACRQAWRHTKRCESCRHTEHSGRCTSLPIDTMQLAVGRPLTASRPIHTHNDRPGRKDTPPASQNESTGGVTQMRRQWHAATNKRARRIHADDTHHHGQRAVGWFAGVSDVGCTRRRDVGSGYILTTQLTPGV